MKTTAALSIAALLAAMAATPVLADDASLGLSGGVGVNVSSDDNDTNAGVNVGVDAQAGVNTNDDEDNSSVSVGAGVDAQAGASTDDGNTDTSLDAAATGSAGVNANGGDGSSIQLDALLSLIADTDYSDDSMSTWTDASATSVIKTDDLFDTDAQAQIDAAVKSNWDEHEDLNAAINANANLKAWLDANDIDADSVIAIEVGADGSVDVYEG